jgi:iron complex transport system substrate-binding protein
LLGEGQRIVGVSEYVERPPEAKALPCVTQFIRSDIQKIIELKPDLIIGFSDLQKDIARELIGRGQNVLVTNQRKISEILDYIRFLGSIVEASSKARDLVASFESKILKIKNQAAGFKHRPKVYFEEWDHPRLSGIGWVSELIEICGGENIFHHRSGPMAMNRKVTDEEIIALNPDIIFGCWCGKKVNIEAICNRPGYQELSAVKNNQIFELDPAIFLQPGPALFVDGLDQIFSYFSKLNEP